VNRSHAVLAAVVLFAVLAIVELLRGDGAVAPHEIAVVRPQTAEAPLPPVASRPEPPTPATAREVSVSGRVTNAAGDRVPGVRISITGGRADEAVTDTVGRYALRIELGRGELPSLRFFADGYQDARVELEPSSLAGDSATLDVRLVPEPGAVVSGVVRSERGGALAGETVQLQSSTPAARLRAVTDEDGRFSIPGVPPGPSYYLSLLPKAAFSDYQRSLAIDPEGASLDIALKPLLTERLRGRLVDPEGAPIPGVSFSIASGQARGRSVRVETDSRGYFEADGVPTGFLTFRADAPTEFVISGVRLIPVGSGEIVLRADWGSQTMRGRVVDGAGRPIRSAEVELTWTHVGEAGTGRSSRRAVTNASGDFRFEGLGVGVRRLDIRAPGYRELEVDYDVSSQSPGLEVALEPIRSET
jgi:hypothetical protein